MSNFIAIFSIGVFAFSISVRAQDFSKVKLSKKTFENGFHPVRFYEIGPVKFESDFKLRKAGFSGHRQLRSTIREYLDLDSISYTLDNYGVNEDSIFTRLHLSFSDFVVDISEDKQKETAIKKLRLCASSIREKFNEEDVIVADKIVQGKKWKVFSWNNHRGKIFGERSRLIGTYCKYFSTIFKTKNLLEMVLRTEGAFETPISKNIQSKLHRDLIGMSDSEGEKDTLAIIKNLRWNL